MTSTAVLSSQKRFGPPGLLLLLGIWVTADGTKNIHSTDNVNSIKFMDLQTLFSNIPLKINVGISRSKVRITLASSLKIFQVFDPYVRTGSISVKLGTV